MVSEAKPSPCRIGDCFGRKERSLAMTPGVPVMASETKPSPCRVGDCFGRKERALAMTAVLSNYDF